MDEPETMKIAILLSSLKFGGAERVSLNLARALQDNACEIDILLMSKEGEFLAEASSSFRVVDLRCRRTYQLPWKLVQYFWMNRPAALISSFWKQNLCSCLARLFFPSVRLILWEHSPPSRSANSPAWLYAISATIFYRMATKIVVVSSGVYNDVARWTIGLRSRLIVILNPIRPPSGLSEPIRSIAEKKRVVSVGRIDKNKNHRLLIEAFSLVAAKRPVELEIVGEGELRPSLEELCSAKGLEGSVFFTGFSSNPYEILTRSDLLVVSSDREGLPSVIIEALYCGLSIVSTNCGEGIEDILLDGKYGRIVPCNDVSALARAVEAELENPRAREGQKIGARRFLPEIAATRFLQFIKSA